MPGLIKTLTSALIGSAMMTSLAFAEAPKANSAAITPEEQLTFSSQSSGPSSLLFSPAYMLAGFMFPDGRHGTEVIGGLGTAEGVVRNNTLGGARLEFGWALASAEAAASSSLFGGLTPYFVLGALAMQEDVTYLTRPGSFFPTGSDASTDFLGVYTGLNMLVFGDPIGAAAGSSAAASSFAFNGIGWYMFGNVGYGQADVDVPAFNFYRSADGLMFEAGTRVLFDFGKIQGGPGVSYFHFDNGPIAMKEVLWTVDFLVPFN